MEKYGQIISLVILLGVFYLLMVRPQQKRQKEHMALMASLVEGDRVITIGGVYGVVRTLEGDLVGIEVSPGIVIEFARSAVASKDQV